jgi:hypothetical protein
MNPRHGIVLFDIDNTLIHFDKSCPTFNPHTGEHERTVAWIGGSPQAWALHVKILRETALSHDIHLHFGIATYKNKFYDDQRKAAGLRGDYLSGAILEDQAYIDINTVEKIKGIGPSLGLKTLLNPELVYFTEAQSKTTHAIKPAIEYIQYQYCTFPNLIQAFLIDDQFNACQEVVSNGHHGICVGNIHQQSLLQQELTISNTFKLIYNKLDLPIPHSIETNSRLLELQIYRRNHQYSTFFPSVSKRSLSQIVNEEKSAVLKSSMK